MDLPLIELLNFDFFICLVLFLKNSFKKEMFDGEDENDKGPLQLRGSSRDRWRGEGERGVMMQRRGEML